MTFHESPQKDFDDLAIPQMPGILPGPDFSQQFS
jgi:hypothetical protein